MYVILLNEEEFILSISFMSIRLCWLCKLRNNHIGNVYTFYHNMKFAGSRQISDNLRPRKCWEDYEAAVTWKVRGHQVEGANYPLRRIQHN